MNLYGKHYDAKPENLVKVAATKDENGNVWSPPRMQSGSFDALVRCGWLTESRVERKDGTGLRRVYTISAKGQAKLDGFKPGAVFEGAHGAKALETFRQLDAKPEDWFHPAVKWVEEERMLPTWVACPDCQGQHDYLKAWYGAEEAKQPSWMPSVRAFQWPRNVKGTFTINGHEFESKDLYFESYSKESARAAYAKEHGLVKQSCRYCSGAPRKSPGHVQELRLRKVMVGYIMWPKGVRFASRFQGDNLRKSFCQCGICGKGITKSNRVPLAHDKNGKALGVWAGSDCARKFTKVAQMAKPSKDENKAGLESVLDENYVVPELE